MYQTTSDTNNGSKIDWNQLDQAISSTPNKKKYGNTDGVYPPTGTYKVKILAVYDKSNNGGSRYEIPLEIQNENSEFYKKQIKLDLVYTSQFADLAARGAKAFKAICGAALGRMPDFTRQLEDQVFTIDVTYSPKADKNDESKIYHNYYVNKCKSDSEFADDNKQTLPETTTDKQKKAPLDENVPF